MSLEIGHVGGQLPARLVRLLVVIVRVPAVIRQGLHVESVVPKTSSPWFFFCFVFAATVVEG